MICSARKSWKSLMKDLKVRGGSKYESKLNLNLIDEDMECCGQVKLKVRHKTHNFRDKNSSDESRFSSEEVSFF